MPTSKARILSAHRTSRGAGVRWLNTTCSVLVLAAVAAVVIEIFRTPDRVPPPLTPFSPQVVLNVRNGLMQTAQRRSTIDAPWPDLNAYLAAVLPPTESSGLFSINFQRAMVFPSADGFTAMVERRLSGTRSYASVSYKVAPRGNGLALVPTGAALGRLRLPAGAAPVVEWLSGGLGNALSTELDALRDARAVTFAPDKVHIDFSVRQP